MRQGQLDKTLVPVMTAACLFALAACGNSQSRGFTLPEGDPVAGQRTFIDLGCNWCHTVEGVTGLREDIDEPELTIPLGGERARVYSYGELVTSVINPSHKISQPYLEGRTRPDGGSLMVNYNDVMTVQEMTDIVTFLEQHYTVRPYQPTIYTPYAPM